MDNWLKRGALALVLGALCTMSGAAMAVPKPGILTPPTKGANPADAKAKPPEPIAKIDKGKGDEKGNEKTDDKGGPPEGAGSAGPAGSAGAPPGTVGAGVSEEKLKEIRAKVKARLEEHKAKVKEHRAEIKKKVEEKLKGQPMVNAMKEELKRHARRISRLERAKDLAEEANDADTIARIDKLIAKENGRHDGWMGKFDAKAAAGGDKAGAK